MSADIIIGNDQTSSGLSIVSECVNVSSGGTAIDTTVMGQEHHYTGTMYVYAGGMATNTTVGPNGQFVVNAGGTATGIKESGGCVVLDDKASATFAKNIFSGRVPWMGIATVHSGTTSYRTTIASGGTMYVYSGGLTSSATVTNRGSMYISSGGSVKDVDIFYSGFVSVSSGGTVTRIIVNEYGSIYAESGAFLDNVTLDSGLLTVSSGAVVSNLDLYEGGVLHVSSGGSVINLTSKGKGGTIEAEEGAVITYKGNTSSSTKLEISSDCDSGWNDSLYANKKKKQLNTSVCNATPKTLTAGTTDIQLDKSGISTEGKSNYVGYGDECDFTKISLDCGARLVFNLDVTASVKFTIWSLGAKGKLKSHQTITVKNAQLFDGAEAKKSILLEKGEYYISVQSKTAGKGGGAYYNVSLNDSSQFYSKAKDFDNDWSAFKEDSYKGDGYLKTLTSAKKDVFNSWVGFGDAVDYRKFTLTSAAKLNLTVTATDAVKFSICMVNRKGKLKILQTVKLKKQGENDYSVQFNSVLLDKGDYYFRVESTNAKKGGDADYHVTQNTAASVYFDGADESDDWDDVRSAGPDGRVGKVGKITDKNKAVVQNDWVGYDDTVDYFQFVLDSDAELSFNIRSTDVAKFTVYELKEKQKKRKGVTTSTYSLKKLQTTKITGADSLQPTKSLSLKSGTYYFSMQSTNAKKGGKATYDIIVNDYIALPKSEKTELALTGPADDNGWDSAAGSDASGFVMPETSEASGFVNLSGVFLAETGLPVPDADAAGASPIPVCASDELFDGLADATGTITDVVAAPADATAGVSQNELLPQGGLLA